MSSAHRFRELLDVVPDAMLIADGSGRILGANRQAQELLGYTQDELLGLTVESLLPERFRGRHVEHRAAYVAGPRPRPMGAALALFARRKDGSEFPTEISLSPMQDPAGPLVIAAIRDISERRRMQESLRESEERLRLLVQSVSDYAICMLDAEGRVRTWNAAAESITGYTAEEIVGRDLALLYDPQDAASGQTPRVLAAAVRSGAQREEGWRRRRDGSRFQAEVTINALFEPGGTLRGFALVMRDVSERKQAQAEREGAIQARDEVLALLSHDLQNSINALALNTHLLLRVQPSTERELHMHRYGQIVGRSTDAMKRLMRDLLDVQHIDSGRFSIEPRREAVVPLVEESLEALHALADERSIRLETRLDAAGWVLCDRDRILQVLHNLVGNAIKFVPEGGQIVVGTAHETREVKIAVEDDGPGILPEDLPHVFDRHWRAQADVLRRGSGLGLFIVKTIVEAHRGRTWAQSTPGAGASFFFTLPGESQAPAR